MKSVVQSFACAAILSTLMGAASAQTSSTTNDYTSVSEKYDCSQTVIRERGTIDSVISNTIDNEGRKSREKAIAAARQAISAGYNYALMQPWERNDYTKIVHDEVNFAGIDIPLTAEFKRSKYSLLCRALSDQKAHDFIWGDDAANLQNASTVALVDLRQMIGLLDPASVSQLPAKRPALDDSQFKRAGERETYLRTAAVKASAAQCYTSLIPFSETQFKRPISTADRTQQNACLQNLSNEARASGWADFPLFVAFNNDSLATKGYSINSRPSDTSSSLPKAPAEAWGDGWYDISQIYPSFDGTFLTREAPGAPDYKSSAIILLASNTMTEAQLLDYAVYHSARARLRNSQSGIVLVDETQESKSKFEASAASAAKKDQNNISSQMNKVQRLDKKIIDAQEDIEGYARDVARISAKSYASEPSAQARIQKYIRKGEEAKAELASLKAERAAYNADTSAVPPSKLISGDYYQGVYYAFEQNYKSLLILDARAMRTPCNSEYLVCADKLQAYNTLGPRLGADGHYAVAPPARYEVYDTTVR